MKKMLSAERNNLKLPEIGLEFEKMSRCPPVFYLAFLCVRARERESKSDNLFDPEFEQLAPASLQGVVLHIVFRNHSDSCTN
jgi:hypothetical protein